MSPPKRAFTNPTPFASSNDKILASAGSRWDDWLELHPGWTDSPKAEQFREEALDLLREEFGRSRLFVLRDPRICRLLPFWLGVLEEVGVQPLIVSPVRNPLEVAASLEARGGFEAGLAQLMWLRHVLDAEIASRGTTRYFTSHDHLTSGWARTVAAAESALGVAWPRQSEKVAVEIEAFLSRTSHDRDKSAGSVLDNPTLSDWLRSTFEILARWLVAGEDPQDFAALDRIRAALNGAAPAFSRLLSAEQAKSARLQRDLETRADAAKATEQALAESQAKLKDAEQVAKAKHQALTESQAKLKDAEQVAKAKDQALAESRANLEEAEAATAAERDRAARLETDLGKERQRLAEAEQLAMQLKGELSSRAQAAEAAETALAEVRHRLAQTESALAQRSHEAEQTAGELTTVRDELLHATTARSEADKVSAGLKEHITLLMADVRLRQTRAAEQADSDAAMAKQVRHVLAVLETSRDELSTKLSQAEQDLEALRRTIDARQGEVDHERAQIERLRQVAAREIGRAAGLLNGRGGPLFWKRFRLSRQAALLKHSGIFDAEWYLSVNTDVADAGIDPLRHYVEFGAREGRAPNPALLNTSEVLPDS